jgi:hypothetical protein
LGRGRELLENDHVLAAAMELLDGGQADAVETAHDDVTGRRGEVGRLETRVAHRGTSGDEPTLENRCYANITSDDEVLAIGATPGSIGERVP